ncbi:sensor histidine kinase [Micromonospora eburnea]|uniref:histidine kinase n=1 Tax=Micromonospora eburnea TaxID=227316 RepID=A0A1C6UKP1_9ACTN|nr:HAMP domain-containing sensor histidine kinase [Micromonospora eburnea]SCL54459.1 Signal transduction histidine kinase [Micromonospora eburnea]
MPRRRRWGARWDRLPLRVRLVAGFAAAMLVVLTGAGAFVYLRVRYALDLRLDEDLATLSAQLTTAARSSTPPAAAARTGPGEYWQLLDAANHVLAASPGLPAGSLLTPEQLDRALRQPVRADRGTVLPISPRPLRLYAAPVRPGAAPAAGQPAVTVAAVRRDQRDEALRELIGQLALANLAALAIASLVGYRLARAALAPVERYRGEAARIAAGATGVRLAVPATGDEVARLGRTLNDMLAALESALDRERQFINDASHELRTPLTLLAAELELALRRPRTTAELEQALRDAAADTADLIALADALLTIGTQPEQDDATPTVDLTALVTTTVDRYRTRTGTEPTALRCRAEPGLTVRGDATRLGRAVTNLLDNATRYGAPPITVAGSCVDSLVRITVHDEGPGIEPAFLPHATERFRRGDVARTSPGTGLGLSIVDAIVRAHHGELRLCSAGVHQRVNPRYDVPCEHPPHGTTVTVLLPAARR